MCDCLPPDVFGEQTGAVEAGQHPGAEAILGRCVELQEHRVKFGILYEVGV
ncbi:hypothetical protein [Streptomyces malaysiensis]|uniref:hypothetical protein n=1 Tax=Streptomyces malaysiensis TaxID=92644 RepID=UPI002B2F9C5F|nr:hypothetical protein R8789_46495 [Streptomyces malaysiensis]